ncbi:hypothetical protein [Allorhodopirellula heiligendammensis]|uniref:Acid-resistance membrane protein n=1 Tax=Allorhodopirellula heiligendammensis TaxID=2714739 RepID=A0A5C6BJ76_9BACT|nr:hypothetical protein [Allorhodopirellula heiligendammensis]TWU10494.1 hypothetical protein Poly21_43980 [Allorhodopirellula heiligendammensis]
MSDPINPYAPSLETTSPPIPTQGNYEALAATARGLRIIHFGIVLMLLCLIGMTLSFAIFPQAIAPLGLLMLVGFLMWLIGPMFCLTAPPETQTKGFVIVSIICQLSALMIAIAKSVGVVNIRYSSLATNLLAVISVALFILAMMRIASSIQREDLRAAGRRILRGGVVLICMGLVSVFGIVLMGMLTSIILVVVLFGMLIIFVMYANLVNSLATAIDSLKG